MPTVFLISDDWMLRTPLRAELLEQGIEALGFDCASDALHAASDGHWPALVITDDASAGAGHPEMSALLRRSNLLLIASSGSAPPGLPPGATTMCKPVRIGEIAARVRQMLEGQPA